MARNTQIGEHAYEIITNYRDQLGDRFSIEPLEAEFPYYAEKLRRNFGAYSIYLARAGDNEAGTSKTRGAIVGAAALKEKGIERIRLASAGNHARGSAVAARVLDMEANIAVPLSAPPSKSDGLYSLLSPPQLRVHKVGDTFDATYRWIEEQPDLGAMLHPYDNPDVIAGQGTLADDIYDALPYADRIVIPVGGGGHFAGIHTRAQELWMNSMVVHGVEASGSDSLSRSLRAGHIVDASQPNPRYGGSAVRQVGWHAFQTFKQARQRFALSYATDEQVDELIDSYHQTRHDLWRLTTPAYEPTTLVAIAGLTTIARQHPDETIVVVGTGHNAPLPSYT